MTEAFSLKPISRAAVARALERVERYRLLNQPEQAESICLDILEADPGNQAALVELVLAITDQFGSDTGAGGAQKAREHLARLTDQYQRCYYGAIIEERQARAALARGISRPFAYESFRRAMDLYEQAEPIRPEGDDSAILRWNACVRTIEREQLKPRPAEQEQFLE